MTDGVGAPFMDFYIYVNIDIRMHIYIYICVYTVCQVPDTTYHIPVRSMVDGMPYARYQVPHTMHHYGIWYAVLGTPFNAFGHPGERQGNASAAPPKNS